jgi:hypothetical protein
MEQTYKSENYIVKVKEDEDAYFYALKDGEKLSYALKIIVYTNKGGKQGKEVARYAEQWDEEISSNSINKFIKDILEKPEYREGYLIDGDGFNEVVKFSDDTGVNIKCKQAIDAFYKKNASKRKFKDYAGLKTYGIDKYSRMKLEKIAEILSQKDIDTVSLSFKDDEKSILTALRWCCRGLKVDDAIRKVKTDLEISANARGY